MDLLQEEELTGMKSQYAATIVGVSIVTYAVAIGLVMFVDRQKIKPLVTRLRVHFTFFGRKMRGPLEEEDPAAAGPSGGTEDQQTTQTAASRPWAALWASTALRFR